VPERRAAVPEPSAAAPSPSAATVVPVPVGLLVVDSLPHSLHIRTSIVLPRCCSSALPFTEYSCSS
jgi:hypothetical protein